MPDDVTAGASTASVITYTLPPLTAAHIESFRKATHTEHFGGMPPTFVTYFRKAEFAMLDEMKVNMRHLLHTGQEYEYLAPLKPGDVPVISTRVVEVRERKGMKFVTAESDVKVNGESRLRAITSFVVSTPKEAT